MTVRQQSAARAIAGCLAAALALGGWSSAGAQSCVTQAKMTPELRTALSDAAMNLAKAVQAGDTAKVRSLASTALLGQDDAARAANLDISGVTGKVRDDSFQVSQLYELSAPTGSAGTKTDFTCPLTGSVSETDFSIGAPLSGTYGFAMVEAAGDRPWVLTFLLRLEGGAWKMVAFNAHARTAAGHDGGWYWNAAFQAAKARQNLLAWLLYGEADALLQPAAYVTSTKLDSLRAQQQAATPPEIAPGISRNTPWVLNGADGTAYYISRIQAGTSEDGQRLRLVLNLQVPSAAGETVDPEADKARVIAVAKILLGAHQELRQAFDSVYGITYHTMIPEPGAAVVGETLVPSTVTEQKLSEIP